MRSDFLRSAEARVLALLVIVLTVGALKEPRLLDSTSISGILLGIPIIAIMAFGQMGVIVTRGIDVSVGSTLGLSAMVAGITMRATASSELVLGYGIIAAIGTGLLLGILNGALVAWARVPPIIATLGTLSAFRGATFIVSHGEQIDSNDIPVALTSWSLEGPLWIGTVTLPWILVLAAAVAVAAHLFYARMRAGRDLFAIGSNPMAAHLRGVRVSRATLTAYGLCGALAGLSGLLYASRYGFVNPGTAGLGMELTVIAAAVIGGCDVRGGTGSVLGVLLGSLLLSTVNVALAVLGIAATWQLLAYGLVIVIALALDAATRSMRARSLEGGAL